MPCYTGPPWCRASAKDALRPPAAAADSAATTRRVASALAAQSFKKSRLCQVGPTRPPGRRLKSRIAETSPAYCWRATQTRSGGGLTCSTWAGNACAGASRERKRNMKCHTGKNIVPTSHNPAQRWTTWMLSCRTPTDPMVIKTCQNALS
eukprot:365053-Chlamydomonas_euryale.AAC.9